MHNFRKEKQKIENKPFVERIKSQHNKCGKQDVENMEKQAGAELGQAQISYQQDTLALKLCWEFMQLLWSIGKEYLFFVDQIK